MIIRYHIYNAIVDMTDVNILNWNYNMYITNKMYTSQMLVWNGILQLKL